MMSIRSKREVLERVVRDYWATGRAERRRILEESVAITACHQKNAIHVWPHPIHARPLCLALETGPAQETLFQRTVTAVVRACSPEVISGLR